MKNQSKLWIDITDMSMWGGHPTGTQRVVYEIGRRLHETDPAHVGFFIYDEAKQVFHEASFQPVIDRIRTSLQPPKAAAPVHTRSLAGKLKQSLVRYYQQLPYGIRSKITDEHKKTIKNVYRKLRDIKNRRTKRQALLSTALVGENPRPLHFGADENVLLLGKPWDTMSFIGTLSRQKMEQDFGVIHLVYDLIPVYLPHVFGKPLPVNYTAYMFEALSITNLALPISVSSKNDIKRFCDDELLPVPQIEVVRLGDTFMPRTRSTAAVAPLEGKDFILCVGTMEIRKNHILLYTALREMLARGQDIPYVVIVGGKGWYVDDVLYEFENDPLIKQRIIRPQANDQELAWLYQNCLFTIYPSVYEGWGLPIAESLYYGKACIASKTSSMPEVGGELVDYFSPYDSGECATLIAKYTDPETRRKREAKIRKDYKPVTWDDTAKQVERLLRSFTARPRS